MGDLPVFDVVLLPPPEVNARSIHLSRQCASLAPTEFVLREEGTYPHISLYMANFTPAQCRDAVDRLRDISGRTGELLLEAEHFSGNEHGMFELFYRRSEAIVRLQEELIDALNPLRTGLRRLDPVGRILAEHRLTAPPVARANLDRYGYDEIGELFRPHITLTRTRRRDERFDPAVLPAPESFTGTYRTLALCTMGEHGTCTDLIETFELPATSISPAG
ncbi:hypothetical protein HII36_53490 [Nonomuraea sp. NN258]|uniref:DUF1045 domain-containing protein n=1 Tax=Nonomuraea antri TaxID=2730852 RepID=UPI00156886F1|nr:DUF1045 domain-containing protein [Nonomuraea antri]NRQ40567.1 hypothetical protein [Nonomuraea antri]